MRFQKLDLNLLVALDALLLERHVSRAARRLNLSQSAMSAALARLRDYFEDDLLVMRGRMMALTPRALDLVAPVGAVLEQIRVGFLPAASTAPAAGRRDLRIMVSDGIGALLLPDLLRYLEERAPGLRLDIRPLSEPARAVDSCDVDLAILAGNALSPGHPTIDLFTDDHVVIGWADNPALCHALTEQTYLELGHVTVFGDAGAEGALPHRIRVARRKELVAPGVLVLPALLSGTRRVAILPRRLALHLAAGGNLVMQDVPFPVTPMRLKVQWNAAQSGDPLLEQVIEEMKASIAIGINQ